MSRYIVLILAAACLTSLSGCSSHGPARVSLTDRLPTVNDCGAEAARLFEIGKAEFAKPFAEQDYGQAVAHLSEAARLAPQNPEIHYFLGYAYGRMYAKDAKSLIDQPTEISLIASDEMAKVIALTPRYEGEIIAYDPYSKQTSIWGALALKFMYFGLEDSTNWAFTESRKRGGFSDPLLELSRNLLRTCKPDAILFTYGDIVLMPLLYLQMMEKYRQDVSIIDFNLLNTEWYPRWIIEKESLPVPDSLITGEYTIIYPWTAREMKITGDGSATDSTADIGSVTYTWVVHPSMDGRYILRNELILLAILEQNHSRRPTYVEISSLGSVMGGLETKFVTRGLASELLLLKEPGMAAYERLDSMLADYRYNELHDSDIVNAQSLVNYLNTYRYAHLRCATAYLDAGDTVRAGNILRSMDERIPQDYVPVINEDFTRDCSRLREAVGL